MEKGGTKREFMWRGETTKMTFWKNGLGRCGDSASLAAAFHSCPYQHSISMDPNTWAIFKGYKDVIHHIEGSIYKIDGL